MALLTLDTVEYIYILSNSATTGVHDSYWTHACDVDEMNRILCEKFVELYEAPILENLLESFEKSFPKLDFPPLPQRRDLISKKFWTLPISSTSRSYIMIFRGAQTKPKNQKTEPKPS